MAKIEIVNNVNDYVHYVGAEELHPHVAVIHYDELDHVRHCLNNYNVYGLFLQKEFPYGLSYGMGNYSAAGGSLIAVAPGQIGGMSDDGTIIHLHGWVLMFDQDFVRGTDLEKHMGDYHFFNYNNNEALQMKPDEKRVLATIIKMIRMELKNNDSGDLTDDIVRSYIQLILQYCQRFYNRQFHEVTSGKTDLLVRFRKVLEEYYEKNCKSRMARRVWPIAQARCFSLPTISAMWSKQLPAIPPPITSVISSLTRQRVCSWADIK